MELFILKMEDWDNLKIDIGIQQENFKGEKEIRNLYNPTTCVNMLLKGVEKYSEIRSRKL